MYYGKPTQALVKVKVKNKSTLNRCLSVYLGDAPLPKYQVLPAKYPEQNRIIVKPDTAKVCIE